MCLNILNGKFIQFQSFFFKIIDTELHTGCSCCGGGGSKWWRYLNKLYRRLSMPHKISFAHFYVSFNYNSVVYKASIIIQCCLSNSYSNYSNPNDEHLFSLLQFGLSSPSKNSQASFHVCERFRCGYFFLKKKMLIFKIYLLTKIPKNQPHQLELWTV